MKVPVRRQGLQAWIFHGCTDREMVQTLPTVITDTKHFMHDVIEKAADSGGSNPCSFSFQIKDLPNQSCFPEQACIKTRTVLFKAGIECSQHPKRKGTVCRNILMTTDDFRNLACVSFLQPVQRERLRTIIGFFPT